MSELEKVNKYYDFLNDKQLEHGIVKHDFSHKVLSIPIIGIDDINKFNCGYFNTTIERKDISNIRVSFHSVNLGAGSIKHEAAHKLATQLIDEGYLNSYFNERENIIEFSINKF